MSHIYDHTKNSKLSLRRKDNVGDILGLVGFEI